MNSLGCGPGKPAREDSRLGQARAKAEEEEAIDVLIEEDGSAPKSCLGAGVGWALLVGTEYRKSAAPTGAACHAVMAAGARDKSVLWRWIRRVGLPRCDPLYFSDHCIGAYVVTCPEGSKDILGVASSNSPPIGVSEVSSCQRTPLPWALWILSWTPVLHPCFGTYGRPWSRQDGVFLIQ